MKRLMALGCLAGLAGCATLTETNQQMVTLQTIEDNREVAGVGCILSNKMGRWFVTSPGRVTIRRSAGELEIDCKKDDVSAGYGHVASKSDATLWGNLVLTAGLGYLVDHHTGAGFDYPDTLVVIMRKHAVPVAPEAPPANAANLF